MTLEKLWALFPVIITPYNPEWAAWYEEERNNLLTLLEEETVRISHIGSTAVKGLAAKPTVDMLLEITEVADITKVTDKLISGGWLIMAQSEAPKLRFSFNKGYTPDGFADKVYHLHVIRKNDPDELYFRDYLIAHQDVAKEYEKLKYGLKEKFEHHRDGYTEAKTEFISAQTKAARQEYKKRYDTEKQ
ncbi:MAG: GrpB family protein [Bacteroidales bacterium]|nr:GrpB family protein [Bacteroidales bacterium]